MVFVCLLSCWFVLALGKWIVYGLCKGPHLLSFVAFFTDGFACISIQFPASRSLCNDLAKALEALDGKKRALTNQPSVQLVPVRSRWSFDPVYHCNFVVRLVPLGSRCRATPKRRHPRRSMAPRKHQAHPGAVPFPHQESQVKPRRVDPLTE